MVVLQTKTTEETFGWDLGGRADFKDDVTIPQDAGRVTGALLFLTIMSKAQNGEMSPLTNIDPALTAAYLTCAANAGLIAAYAAVADGEFAITVDGQLINVTGLDFNTVAVTTFQQVADIINVAAAGRFVCRYDLATDIFSFYSTKTGLPASTITILAVVAAGAGTDISGAGFLNGLAGAVTLATGELSTALPSGFFGGPEITQAEIVAGDMDNQKIMVKGFPKNLVESKVVLEGGLALTDVIPSQGKTIKEYIQDTLDIILMPTENENVISPLA